MATSLLSPVQLGPYQLANRVVMAPLTRTRAAGDGVPTEAMARYYALRATAGLLIAEATNISPQGRGYLDTPGIFSEAQVQGWTLVTQAVHRQGGRIFLQLWHVGRISHPDLQPGKVQPVAPSAITPRAQIYTQNGMVEALQPRALELAEIPGIVADYRRATENAVKAGFDGVEIHAANGYLIDQFLRDGSNRREDAYGGSIGNRIRFLREVVEAVVVGAGGNSGKVGIRLSPLSSVNDMTDSNPEALFTAVIDALNPFRLAYVHVVEGITRAAREVEGGFDLGKLRERFKGLYIGNSGYTQQLAEQRLASGAVDLVAFGRPFIANPDLVERFRRGADLNKPDTATFYGQGEHGYLDYPTLS